MLFFLGGERYKTHSGSLTPENLDILRVVTGAHGLCFCHSCEGASTGEVGEDCNDTADGSEIRLTS